LVDQLTSPRKSSARPHITARSSVCSVQRAACSVQIDSWGPRERVPPCAACSVQRAACRSTPGDRESQGCLKIRQVFSVCSVQRAACSVQIEPVGTEREQEGRGGTCKCWCAACRNLHFLYMLVKVAGLHASCESTRSRTPMTPGQGWDLDRARRRRDRASLA
jgi:hypothetical protein